MRKLILLVLLLSQGAFANPMWEQWKADQAFRQGDYKGAIAGYERALKEADTPRVRYNMALAQAKSGDVKSAQKGFEDVMQGDDLELRGKAAYNLGNLLYRQNQLQPALDAYKKALRYNENDEDARHNAWVCIQKLKQQQQNQQPKNQDQNKDKKDQDKDKKSGQDQKDQKDQKSGQNDDKKDQKSGGKDPKDQDGKGQQDKNDQSGGKDQKSGQKDDKSGKEQPGKGEDKKDQAQAGKGQDKKDQQPPGQQPQPNGPGQKPEKDKGKQPMSPEAAAAQARKQEAEQLLQYFSQKEKQETGDRARQRGVRFIPRTGGQTW